MNKYQIGYLPGSFDLFHIGHLNMIRRAKESCDYLIVGAVNDELNRFYKGEYPFICLPERLAILEAIRYVDRAVEVDFRTTDKLIAWQEYQYDVHFAGSDHQGKWPELEQKLQQRGASLEFFPYTESTSSTQIKALISGSLGNAKLTQSLENRKKLIRFQEAVLKSFVNDYEQEKVIIIGAGKRGRKLAQLLQRGNRQVIMFLDNDLAKQGQMIDRIPCQRLEKYKLQLNDELILNCTGDEELERLVDGRNVVGTVGVNYLMSYQETDEIDIKREENMS